jgi:hypothetical protein
MVHLLAREHALIEDIGHILPHALVAGINREDINSKPGFEQHPHIACEEGTDPTGKLAGKNSYPHRFWFTCSVSGGPRQSICPAAARLRIPL